MPPAQSTQHRGELSDALATGLEELDVQHRYFLKLTEAVSLLAKNADRESVNYLILEVVRYAQCHFAFEETMMSVYDYPNREHHVAEHAAIIEAIKQTTATEPLNFAQARLQLIQWLHTHIPLDDKPLADFVLANRPAIITAEVSALRV